MFLTNENKKGNERTKAFQGFECPLNGQKHDRIIRLKASLLSLQDKTLVESYLEQEQGTASA